MKDTQSHLLYNKEIDGRVSYRPYFCAFEKPKGTYWMIPISHKTEKYHNVLDTKQSKSRFWSRYNTIMFGDVFGKERAFLIQNMCPVTDNELYISGEYPAVVESDFCHQLISEAKHIFNDYSLFPRLIFVDIEEILRRLDRNASIAACHNASVSLPVEIAC